MSRLLVKLDLALRDPEGSGVPSLGVPGLELLPLRVCVGVDRPDDGADLVPLSKFRFLRATAEPTITRNKLLNDNKE